MDWFWLLAFAGLMFVMHRFGMGCCGGHSHGDHSGHQHGPERGKPPEKTAEPGKGAAPLMASADGNGGGMACCGGHAQAERAEGAAALPPKAEERKA